MIILVVDDDIIISKLFNMVLKSEGYETITARSGTEAMQILETQPAIDLVLSDIMMKDGDGLELLAKTRGSSKWSQLPFILCTASKNSENVLRAARLGCRHFLLKPCDRSLLLAKVAEALACRAVDLHDKAEIIKMRNIDESTYHALLQEFDVELSNKIEWIEQAINRQTSTSVTVGIGNLLESAEFLRADRLAGILKKTQDKALHTPLDIDDYQTLLQEIKHLLGKIKC